MLPATSEPVFTPATLLVVATDAGVLALWGALSVWFAARAVGVRTPGRACLRVRGDCQNTISRPRARV